MKSFKSVPKRAVLMSLMLALLTTSGTTLAVNSSSVQITVKGTVGNQSCTVVGGNSQTVDLGIATPAILNTTNSAWVWNTFTIDLENCPAGMKNATIILSGEPDPDNALYFKNIAVASESVAVADNVAVQLETFKSQQPLSNGSQLLTGINNTTHQAQFELKARMITPLGEATAGIVKGHIDYTVEYQ